MAKRPKTNTFLNLGTTNNAPNTGSIVGNLPTRASNAALVPRRERTGAPAAGSTNSEKCRIRLEASFKHCIGDV
jgi:hypothetical protein